MSNLLKIGAAAVLALGLTGAAAAPANAFWHGPGWGGPGPAIGAGIVGFGVGAAIAGAAAADRDRYDDRYADEDSHVQACADAHPSYSVRTDTWIDTRGRPHRCTL
jgi:hypothetical protein